MGGGEGGRKMGAPSDIHRDACQPRGQSANKPCHKHYERCQHNNHHTHIYGLAVNLANDGPVALNKALYEAEVAQVYGGTQSR